MEQISKEELLQQFTTAIHKAKEAEIEVEILKMKATLLYGKLGDGVIAEITERVISTLAKSD